MSGAAPRTLVAVHAHPDDESITTGGTLARYAASGVRTVLITCTDGATGEISEPPLATPDTLVEVRSRELDEACRILGVSRVVRLGYRDSGMAGTADNEHPRSFHRADLSEAAERIAAVLREERPHVVITYDERGGYGHPDHVRAHRVVVEALRISEIAARLFYVVMPRATVERFAARVEQQGRSLPFAKRAREYGVTEERITTRVDVTQWLELKREAFLAHRTQLGPRMIFAELPEGVWADFSGLEYFQCVSCLESPAPADDLFAGL